MIGHTRWLFREVTSTQDVAWRLAAMGASHGTVVRADYQTAGRGREGRRWDAPANTALTFSVVLRPSVPLHQLGPLSIRLGTILCETFQHAGAPEVSLKWPNDVLVGGRKVSGILVQTRTMPGFIAVAGIGINVSSPVDALPDTATSLAIATGRQMSNEDLLDDILGAMDREWMDWAPELTPSQIATIDDRLWLNGQEVTLLDGKREIAGVIVGISTSGALRLAIAGVEHDIYAGEITRGPRPIE